MTDSESADILLAHCLYQGSRDLSLLKKRIGGILYFKAMRKVGKTAYRARLEEA